MVNMNRLQYCHEIWKIRFREPGYSFEHPEFLTHVLPGVNQFAGEDR